MDVIEIFNRICYRYAGETHQDFKMGWEKVVKIVVKKKRTLHNQICIEAVPHACMQ
jgi:hypothetical protein